MRRLFRFLATVVVLLGLLPCGMREALPVVGELVAACCADEVDAGEQNDDGVDCCDTAACLCAARATAPMPLAEALFQHAYLLGDGAVRVDPPGWRAGPPPTPPPIA
ncbi:MAG: hypothetical protein Q8P41_29055 [Pseudomonadota bacterium]|nr:hypothetical protein [Pseudomonadota bacterium]